MVSRKAKSNKKVQKTSECITPDCTNDDYTRGVCHRCYTSHYRAVADGHTTWEELERLGLVLPKQSDLSPAKRARDSAGIPSS